MPESAPTPAPAAPKNHGILKTVMIWVIGLGAGSCGTYFTAVFNTIIKPPLPVANFSVSAEGLTATCQNHATGTNGWWDFGDGSNLEPFDPEQPTVTHAYTKPGSYSVKLTVRNLTSDENDRTVGVEVSAASKDAPPPPAIAGYTVQLVSPATTAPATFRVTADVSNADYCVWDLGDGRTEVVEGGGKIDRLVTFDKAGSFPVQMVAHNGKSAAKQAATVKVDAPPDGTLIAVVTISDGGTQLDRVTRPETIAIPAAKDKATTFSKTLVAKPRNTFVEIAMAKPEVPGVKNLKIAIAADKKTAMLTGEWATPGGKTPGADALIPLKVTEERARIQPSSVQHATGVLPPITQAGKASIVSVPLPAMPTNVEAVSRKLDVEVRLMSQGKVYVVASGPLFGRGPIQIPARNIYSPPTASVTTASYDIDAVRVQFEIGTVTQAGGIRP